MMKRVGSRVRHTAPWWGPCHGLVTRADFIPLELRHCKPPNLATRSYASGVSLHSVGKYKCTTFQDLEQVSR